MITWGRKGCTVRLSRQAEPRLTRGGAGEREQELQDRGWCRTHKHVNNTIVWILAFAPLIGLFLEACFAFTVNADTGEAAMDNNKYWFITLALNIGLSYLDENRLKRAGWDTSKFKGMTWLVPVYLFKRAKALNQNLAYFIVWLVCFIFTLTV